MGHVDPAICLRIWRRLAVGAVLLYAVVVLAVGGTWLAQPVLYFTLATWFAILVFRPIRIFDPSRSSALARFEVLATNIAVTLVVAELALRAWALAAGGSPLVRANLDVYRLVPGRDYGAGLVGNSQGYPGPELPPDKKSGVKRIAALGDSFSLGPAVSFTDCYLSRIAEELPATEIGNFGVSGAGPREYREILERDVWRLQPDLVLLAIFVGNDITEAMPRPRRLDPRHHALYLLGERGWKLARARWQTPASAATDRLANPPLSPQIFREVEARRLAICLKETSPNMEKKWRSASAELDAIVQSCQRRNTALAVVLIPDEFQVNDTVLQQVLTESGFSQSELDLDGPQRRLQSFFAERGVPCLDLLPAFRQVPKTYAPYDTHWNVAGNQLAAREIAAWLREVKINSGSD